MNRFARTACAAALLLASASSPLLSHAQTPAPLDSAQRRAVVQRAIEEMQARYVFPAKAAEVATALQRKLAAGAYDALAEPQPFAAQLTADIQAVTADKHIRLRYSASELAERPPGSDEPTPEERAEYRREVEQQALGVARVERLPFNLGYIDLRGFIDLSLAGGAISAAMTLVAHTDALIVDLRKNGGGDPATVAFMSSYLFDQRTHLNSLYFREGDRTEQFWTLDWVPGPRFGQRKPVYVLTSSRTFSGAEEFSYNLKNLKRATLVGETTGGGANPGDMQRLTAHFTLFVPSGRAISPITQTNWEGTGVDPDVKVPAADALRVAQTMALKALTPPPGDAEFAKRLQERLAELQSEPSAPRP